MLRLLGLVISIGLADSMNPSTIGPGLYLASSRSPRRDVLQFTLGVFAVYLFGGVLVALGPGEALLALVPHPGATARYILETIAGAAVLAAGTVVWRIRGRLGRRKPEAERPQMSRRNPAVLGATITIVELPTAFPYFAAIAAIVGSGLGIVDRLFAVLVYNACFVLPLLGILGILSVAPDRAEQILTRIRDFLRRHWPVLVVVVAIAAGAFVLTLGITGLVGEGRGGAARLSRHVRHVIS